MVGLLLQGKMRHPVTKGTAGALVQLGLAKWARHDVIKLHPACRLPRPVSHTFKPGWPLPRDVQLQIDVHALASFRAVLGIPVGFRAAQGKIRRLMENTGRELYRKDGWVIYQTSQNWCFAAHGLIVRCIWPAEERFDKWEVLPPWCHLPDVRA